LLILSENWWSHWKHHTIVFVFESCGSTWQPVKFQSLFEASPHNFNWGHESYSIFSVKEETSLHRKRVWSWFVLFRNDWPFSFFALFRFFISLFTIISYILKFRLLTPRNLFVWFSKQNSDLLFEFSRLKLHHRSNYCNGLSFGRYFFL
jgi:hypothetical protein